MKTVSLVYTICALCVGVVLSTLFEFVQNIPTTLIIGIGSVFLFLFFCYWVHTRRSSLWILMCIAFCIGILITNHAFLTNDQIQQSLRPFLGDTTTIEGVIRAEPDIREDKQFLVIKTNTIDGSLITTNVRVTTYRHSDFEYNDSITVSGKLKSPESFETESGRTFHYDNYLLNKGITATMFQPTIVEHSTGKINIIRGLLRVKKWFLERIQRILPAPESGLLEGLLLGVRSIPDALYDDFRKTGIVHIVVLSGYNVMLVANFIAGLLKRKPRWLQFVGVLGSLLVFMIITGMQTTVIRATIMGGIAATGRIMGSDYSITKSLSLAALVMLLINPLTLMYDISFQLSFLATIGLVYLGPIIAPIFKWIPEQFELRENMIATFATSIFVMPLIAYAIGDLSVVSPITNMIVLPFVAPAMALGFVTALSSILGPIAWVPAIPTYICLWIIVHTALLLGSMEWASVVLPVIPVWGLIGMYGVLFIILFERSGKTHER